jgi:hypothetical protein
VVGIQEDLSSKRPKTMTIKENNMTEKTKEIEVMLNGMDYGYETEPYQYLRHEMLIRSLLLLAEVINNNETTSKFDLILHHFGIKS